MVVLNSIRKNVPSPAWVYMELFHLLHYFRAQALRNADADEISSNIIPTAMGENDTAALVLNTMPRESVINLGIYSEQMRKIVRVCHADPWTRVSFRQVAEQCSSFLAGV
jgi:hypothetical protein